MLVCAVLLSGCATGAGTHADVESRGAIEGVIVSIDTQPWTYDGSAVIQVETRAGRRVDVRLPARWNLCKAPPVDVEALAVGKRVRAIGAADSQGGLVVCQEAAHRLVPVE
jgi:anti-sigma factor RsiW